jgi:hypothetical protein
LVSREVKGENSLIKVNIKARHFPKKGRKRRAFRGTTLFGQNGPLMQVQEFSQADAHTRELRLDRIFASCNLFQAGPHAAQHQRIMKTGPKSCNVAEAVETVPGNFRPPTSGFRPLFPGQ